jgi:hypothetical protein
MRLLALRISENGIERIGESDFLTPGVLKAKAEELFEINYLGKDFLSNDAQILSQYISRYAESRKYSR